MAVREHEGGNFHEITAEAVQAGRHVYYGAVTAMLLGPRLQVVEAEVDPNGCGIGTRLYEALAQEACQRRVQFASDASLSAYSGGFWGKQARKGRAVYSGGRYTIENPCEHAHDLSGVKRKKRSR